jgi:hypothetical protein
METSKETHQEIVTPTSAFGASNDNFRSQLSFGRSLFPEDAVARIFKPSRSVMTSGTPRTRGWRLVFERRRSPFIEPLMGYTGGRDTLTQVELEFPRLESAIRYAERQGLSNVVDIQPTKSSQRTEQRLVQQPKRTSHAFSDATLERLGLSALQDSYDRALDGTATRNDPSGSESWSSPMDVVTDSTLSLQAKRSILMNWAWTEYLIDQAINEGMPEKGRPSRLDEVDQALLALERELEASRSNSITDRKAA